MPWDVFTQKVEVGAAEIFDRFPAPQPDPDRVKSAAALIAASKAPMIFVGSGAIEAGDDMVLFDTADPAVTVNAIIASITAAVISHRLAITRLDDAVQDVLRVKHVSLCG